MKVASVVLAFAALWKGAWDKYNGHWCQNFLKPDLHTISCSSPLFKCFFLRQSLELLMCSSHIQVSQLRATIRYYCTFLALAPFRTKQDKMLIWFDYVRFLDPLSERTSHSYIMQLGVLKIDMQVLNILEKFICLHNPLRLQKTTAHASGWAENRIDYIMYVNLLIWYIISILSILYTIIIPIPSPILPPRNRAQSAVIGLTVVTLAHTWSEGNSKGIWEWGGGIFPKVGCDTRAAHRS